MAAFVRQMGRGSGRPRPPEDRGRMAMLDVRSADFEQCDSPMELCPAFASEHLISSTMLCVTGTVDRAKSMFEYVRLLTWVRS